MVQVEEKKRAAKEAFEKAKTAVQVDDVVQIRQLAKKNTTEGLDEIEVDLERATGGEGTAEDLSSKLSRVVQLTGFSDPVSTLFSMSFLSTRQQRHFKTSQSSSPRLVT
ncbi:hypothetical protein LB505_004368 [Fusarium chuoi]|nr:hypothetical protein LB505_004368 [Fusarium chuoi]